MKLLRYYDEMYHCAHTGENVSIEDIALHVIGSPETVYIESITGEDFTNREIPVILGKYLSMNDQLFDSKDLQDCYKLMVGTLLMKRNSLGELSE